MQHIKLIIHCPYEVVRGGGVSIATYCYISAYAYNSVFNGTISVAARQLADAIRTDVAAVSEVLKELCRLGVLEMRYTHNDTYSVSQESAFVERKRFVILDFDDVQDILKSKYQNRLKLLYFYALVLKTVNLSVTRDKVRGFFNDKPLEYFAKAMDANPVTISRYEKALEDLGIFYILHAHGKAATNLIGLKKHQSLIDGYAVDAGILQRFSSTNQNVSILQKYNALCRGVEYSDREVLDIYNGIVSYNKAHPNKARDLAVFKKYQVSLDNVSA